MSTEPTLKELRSVLRSAELILGPDSDIAIRVRRKVVAHTKGGPQSELAELLSRALTLAEAADSR